MKSLSQKLLSLCSALCVSVIPISIHAATSDPVGAMTVTINEGSDNFIAIPFTAAPSFQGAVGSLTNTSGDIYSLGLGSTFTGGDADALAGFYYVRFLSGAAEGKYFTILNSSTTSVDIDSLGDDLSGVVAGDSFAIYEYYTLSSLFPPATQDTLVVSTGPFPAQRGSEVLLPNTAGTGLNRAPSLKYFITDSAWFSAVGAANADDVILYPDSYIIIRQKSGAGARDLTLFGSVPMGKIGTYITQLETPNDNYIGLMRPVATRLDELDLTVAFTASSGFFPAQRADELLVWESVSGLNPAPNRKFFYYNGNWYDSANGSIANDYELAATSSLIVRKKGGTAQTIAWIETPTY